MILYYSTPNTKMCPERLLSRTNLAIIKRIIHVEQVGIPPKYIALFLYKDHKYSTLN